MNGCSCLVIDGKRQENKSIMGIDNEIAYEGSNGLYLLFGMWLS